MNVQYSIVGVLSVSAARVVVTYLLLTDNSLYTDPDRPGTVNTCLKIAHIIPAATTRSPFSSGGLCSQVKSHLMYYIPAPDWLWPLKNTLTDLARNELLHLDCGLTWNCHPQKSAGELLLAGNGIN